MKEMDAHTFQLFCFELLKERHPRIELKHVDGKAGDEGLDVFAGELRGKPTIWQCKSFPSGVGKSQKAQIRESLRTALKHFSPAYWILCLSIDMDSKARRWFEKLKISYASKVNISDLSASEMHHEVIHRRSLRNHFFPGAAIDPVELKRLITRTGEMSAESLEQMTDANLEDIIERWTERDPRFNYQIVFDGDLGPPPHNPAPGLVMTVSTGARKLNVFARDITSLEANPPTFSMQFKGTGIDKIRSAINTGARQEFGPDELGDLKTDWALLSSATKVINNLRLIIAPSPSLTNRKRSVRVVFRKGNAEPVQYQLMELQPIRAGRQEIEFSLSGKTVPLRLLFILSAPAADGTVNTKLTVEFNYRNREIREIKKSLDAMNLLRPVGQLELIDLETDKPLLAANAELSEETPRQVQLRALVTDLSNIADRFNTPLAMPDAIAEEDYKVITSLLRYMTNGTEAVSDISATLMKSDENKDLVPAAFSNGKLFFRFTHPSLAPVPKLFGTEINTGPVMEECEAEIKDLPEMLEAFSRSAIGEGVRISFRPLGPVRFGLLQEAVERDAIAFKSQP